MANIKDRTEEAIKHWSAWARSGLFYRNVCRSIESEYAKSPERFIWEDDVKMRLRQFKFDQKKAEKVESIICKYLVGTEKLVIIACEVYGAGMTYNEIARRLHIPLRSLMRFRENAFIKIGRNYG